MQCITKKGANSFKKGLVYEHKIANRLKTIVYNQIPIHVGTISTASASPDIPITIAISPEKSIQVNIEAKNMGAFEGGCKALKITPDGMRIEEDCIQKSILGEQKLYNGNILPWYRGLRTVEDWLKEKHIFEKDVYMEAAEDAIAIYYKGKGTQYIQIENKGLYHTGTDPLELGVPMFTSKVVLRIRSTKHMRKIDGQRVPTDITAALQFDRRTFASSPYTLDEGGQLPPRLTFQPAVTAE